MSNDLYTSQVHLKRVLAGQSTAAFTPAPEAVLKMLDPTLFPGMGALNEDDRGRLQCPVRDCGEWHSMLGYHIRARHKSVASVDVIRRALGIPKSRALFSKQVKDKMRARLTAPRRTESLASASRVPRHQYRGSTNSKWSAMARNEADSCPAQLQGKIEALHRDLGRNVSRQDFENRYGARVMRQIRTVFGTWCNAKALCGLTAIPAGQRRRTETAFVVESLRVWVATHGDLPTSVEAQTHDRAPLIPSYGTIMRAFAVDNWRAAMRSAIEHLAIQSERYGSPVRRRV